MKAWLVEAGNDYIDISFVAVTMWLTTARNYAELHVTEFDRDTMKWQDRVVNDRTQFNAYTDDNRLVARITQIEVHG